MRRIVEFGPSEDYLERCKQAAEQLEHTLLQGSDAEQIARRAEYLKEKFSLAWHSPAP